MGQNNLSRLFFKKYIWIKGFSTKLEREEAVEGEETERGRDIGREGGRQRGKEVERQRGIVKGGSECERLGARERGRETGKERARESWRE